MSDRAELLEGLRWPVSPTVTGYEGLAFRLRAGYDTKLPSCSTCTYFFPDRCPEGTMDGTCGHRLVPDVAVYSDEGCSYHLREAERP